jgi:CheY-like chemotaxis protein
MDRAARLTHRLLAFARRQTLQPVLVEPGQLVRGMEELIRRTVGPAIRLDLNLHDSAWCVLCDPNQLESALLNLCINARDAMPDGGTLTVTTVERVLGWTEVAGQDDVEPGKYVEISVSDTGIGMASDVIARAFEPFFTTKPFGQGTGLGLSQLYGFLRQSGGFVRLESREGAGTTVRLWLPWHADADAGANEDLAIDRQPADVPRSAEPVVSAGPTVLVVEDESNIRDLITETLRGLHYQVLEAEDGPSGLRIVRSHERIDLLLTDVGLPGLNGRQLADAAREGRPGLPVLLITGFPGTALADMGTTPGMDIMGKPFTLDALTARVSALLSTATAS